uniref:ATPase, AAA family n=1 Tax=uncultured bacterium contig00030 TaxID=1181519 RepID=A0A806K077_9BACT|nr:ATPase, AAA family [uncultured bacterium contig00030]
MDDLFSQKDSTGKQASGVSPLADRMRPRTLEDIIGQDHIVGEGRLLRRAIQADRLSSIILYGPPGTGKTSLAAVIANTTRAAFENLNAVLSGVKDIREVIDRSDERNRLYGKRTILFVDEVHRWNKAQQDALLPWVENGTVILVGATTENPFFEVNRALVSRSRIFQLKALGPKEMLEAARRAITDTERGYGNWKVLFEEGALEHLVEVAGGDARTLLNALELAVETSVSPWPPEKGAEIRISMEAAEESIQRRALLYDRDGDYHFDTISAFIKSIRGSDPDAALYWLAKMVRAGEDPKFIFRRMIILASEDVGLADPLALSVVISCAQAFERIGFPEGSFPLTHACLYLATAPKSNTTLSFFDAMKEVEREDAEVPNHLRDASRDAESFGHGEGYVYPHAYRDHWAAQQYLPSSLKGRTFYIPSVVGYEGKIREEVLQKRELQAAIVLGDSAESGSELLSWSAAAKGREGWFKRLESGRNDLLLNDRNIIFENAAVKRQDRTLIPFANDGLLLWESLRRSPEGLTAAIVNSQSAKDALLRYAEVLDEIEKPLIAVTEEILPAAQQCEEWFSCALFDHILIRCARLNTQPSALAANAKSLLAKGGGLVLFTSPPRLGERISRILKDQCSQSGLASILEKAENTFFNDTLLTGFYNIEELKAAFEENGFTVKTQIIDQKEERLITERDLSAWFNTEQSRWGSFMAENLEKPDFKAIEDAIRQRIAKSPLLWTWKSICLHGKIA